MNSSDKMEFVNTTGKTMLKFLIIILSVYLVDGCKTLSMTKTDNIKVTNNSEYKLHVLINFNYPDTAIANSSPNTYVDPNDFSTLKLVNRSWADFFEDKEKAALYFVEWKPADFYESGRQGQQQVYGKLILSQAKLDSLGGEIVFPDDVNQNGM